MSQYPRRLSSTYSHCENLISRMLLPHSEGHILTTAKMNTKPCATEEIFSCVYLTEEKVWKMNFKCWF
jgi:hypothetical protein